jgi:hypothetical protein
MVYKYQNEHCAIPIFNVLRITSPKGFLSNAHILINLLGYLNHLWLILKRI